MKKTLAITGIIIFAILLRLAYVGFVRNEPTVRAGSDEVDYDHLAFGLAAGNGYVDSQGNPTSRRAPLVPAVFALLYIVFGHSIAAVRIAQALVGASTCFVVYLIGKDVFSEKVGLLSAGLSAIYPIFIVFTGMLLSETIFIFFLVLAVYFLAKKSGRAFINYFLAGALFGLAALARPSVLPLPFFILFVSAIFTPASIKGMLKKALILTVAVFIVIAPWTARNYCVHKEFVLISTQFGPVILSSYFYPEKGFGFSDTELQKKLTEGVSNEVERSRILTRYAMESLARNPLTFIRLLPLKFLWFMEPFDGMNYGFGSSFNIVYGLIFVFFLFGLAGSRAAWEKLLPLYSVICYFILASLISYGSRRFRMQAEPFIIIFASYGAFWAAERWKKERLIRAALIIGIAANFFFFFSAGSIKAFSKKIAGFFGYYHFKGDK